MKNKIEQELSDLNDSFKQSLRNKAERNKTLTKNMPNVKWKAIPPVRGPNPQGVNNGRTVQDSNKQMVTRKKVT
tara:strand:+ start:28 stop:249 length:222 start_codon:yes stop_codon:yes gene_type:complete